MTPCDSLLPPPLPPRPCGFPFGPVCSSTDMLTHAVMLRVLSPLLPRLSLLPRGGRSRGFSLRWVDYSIARFLVALVISSFHPTSLLLPYSAPLPGRRSPSCLAFALSCLTSVRRASAAFGVFFRWCRYAFTSAARACLAGPPLGIPPPRTW